MRVTPETRLRTRQSILDAGRTLFGRVGYAATTTRQIAAEAGIAAGTLFNYFAGKEALGSALLAETARAADEVFEGERRPEAGIEELLFQHVAVLLRHLEAHRGWVGEVGETTWSPLRSGGDTDDFRIAHLERVRELLGLAGVSRPDDPVNLHLYWTLYLGVLSFWSKDDSDGSQATLALLDRSMGLYCQALREEV